MFCSLEPTSGEFLDAYPDDVTQKIQALEDGGSIFLGPDFFNATIKKRDNVIYQTTPSVSLLSKKSGIRSVKFVNTNENVQVFYCLESKNWYFHETPTSISSKYLSMIQNLRKFGNVLIWQWSKNNVFNKNYENDWCSYGLECSRSIEDAFSSGSEHVFIEIGVKKYKITFFSKDNGSSL